MGSLSLTMTVLAPLRMTGAKLFILICVLSSCAIISAQADIPWREAKVRLQQENGRLGGRKGTYFVICTLYYTPKESGFSAARGFDARMETRRGLKGRKYPRDFLLAVKKEGVGRISRPVDGHSYIRYKSGRTYYSRTSRSDAVRHRSLREDRPPREWGKKHWALAKKC